MLFQRKIFYDVEWKVYVKVQIQFLITGMESAVCPKNFVRTWKFQVTLKMFQKCLDSALVKVLCVTSQGDATFALSRLLFDKDDMP